MARITPQNALKLSAWLAVHEPALFRQLLGTTQALQRSPLGRFGFFGGDVLTEFVPDIPSTSFDTSVFTVPDLQLQNITVDSSFGDIPTSASDSIANAIAALPAPDGSVADASPSFWSSLGSGISSAAGSVAKLAGALLSPQTVGAAATAATAYFSSQAKSAQTQAQQAAVNAQLARVAQGGAPAPITYTRDPYTGALVPVYQSNTGAQTLTPSLLNRLSSPATAGLSGLSTPLLLIGGGLLVGSLLLSSHRRSSR
jgi:hypothetical protein